jgi:hypothetical protein
VSLKFPLAALHLELIQKAAVPRPFGVVWVLRNPVETIESSYEKAYGANRDRQLLWNRYNHVYNKLTEYQGDILPVIAERILAKRAYEIHELLTYAQLPSANPKTASIDKTLFRRRV